MRSAEELIEMFLNGEKLVSLNAPIEALGPEMSQQAIANVKARGVKTVNDFRDMSVRQICHMKCSKRMRREILSHWRSVQPSENEGE